MILGIRGSVTKERIEQDYKARALVHHPDKGGDAEMFKLIVKARDVLVADVSKGTPPLLLESIAISSS